MCAKLELGKICPNKILGNILVIIGKSKYGGNCTTRKTIGEQEV